tara:strand:- start:1885 stop:2796 length:912 start_codon:yes stop_codon:yes gene_type:complete
MTTSIAVRAHAKINLDLRILGLFPDGFHKLRTVFQSLSLHDTLTFFPRPGPFSIESTTAGFPLDRSNLIWQAADKLWEFLGRSGTAADIMIQVEKRIPTRAGLGSGSTNAAAALVGLAYLWQAELNPKKLISLAGKLGADVPFFLSGGTALGLGRGDAVSPLEDLPKHWVVLVIPGFGISSIDAYKWYEIDRKRGQIIQTKPQHIAGPWSSDAPQMINELEGSIARRYPDIDYMKTALQQAGASAVSMSGSGSTVFGLFQNHRDALTAVKDLSDSGWQVLLTESLPQTAYARLFQPQVFRSGC